MLITKRTLSLSLTGIALVALTAPAAHAQCATAREIAMTGNGMTHGRIGVDTQAFIPLLNNQTEVATFWESGTPANNSGGLHFGTTSTCPSATAGAQGPGTPWWRFLGASDHRTIRMFLASSGCTLPFCPAAGGSITVLVEDVTADGSDAGFYLITADETPSPIRWYDLSRADPATQGPEPFDVTHPMYPLPPVTVVSSSGGPWATLVTVTYANIEPAVWGVGPEGAPTQQVTTYDILTFHGPAPPARTRSSWGAPHHQVAYTNDPPGQPLSETFEVPCPTVDPDNFSYVAVGLTFDGAVQSYYVGAPSTVPCYDWLATPEPGTEQRPFRRGIGRRAAPRRGR